MASPIGKKGTRKPRRPPRRKFYVSGVDLGNGEKVEVTLTIGPHGVVVRRMHSRKPFMLSLRQAAGAIAVASQRIEMRHDSHLRRHAVTPGFEVK